MRDKFSFQEPLNEEPDGTYITAGQMQFFLNRDEGIEKFKGADPEFIDYYNLCRIYNLVSDLMKEDDECAIMYWDDKKSIVSMGFPTDGIVAKSLASVEPHVIEDLGDDDDEGYSWQN